MFILVAFLQLHILLKTPIYNKVASLNAGYNNYLLYILKYSNNSILKNLNVLVFPLQKYDVE